MKAVIFLITAASVDAVKKGKIGTVCKTVKDCD